MYWVVTKVPEIFYMNFDPKFFLFFSKNDPYRGFSMQENRLRTFPNRENTSLTLIQGMVWVY
jgi:hypothetical protein